jgi:hypothetical protein
MPARATTATTTRRRVFRIRLTFWYRVIRTY